MMYYLSLFDPFLINFIANGIQHPRTSAALVFEQHKEAEIIIR